MISDQWASYSCSQAHHHHLRRCQDDYVDHDHDDEYDDNWKKKKQPEGQVAVEPEHVH